MPLFSDESPLREIGWVPVPITHGAFVAPEMVRFTQKTAVYGQTARQFLAICKIR